MIPEESKTKSMLLGRAQVAIRFSYRCNYACSYCTVRDKWNAKKSIIEHHTPELIGFLNQLDPAFILASGGEPLLWKDLPYIIDETPKHLWGLCSNLSFAPDWLRHPRIKLLFATYHPEASDPDEWGSRLQSLIQDGARVSVKLIVHYPNEYDKVPLWEKWNGMSIPTHFCPVEAWPGHRRFSLSFLNDLLKKYRTSCVLNSTFHRGSREGTDWYRTPCIAGTKYFFVIKDDGIITRCAQCRDARGTIFKPTLAPSPLPCTTKACFCVQPFWAGVTPVNDNPVWEKYIETGVWEIPTEDELVRFVEAMGWELNVRGIPGT